jgi:hypothetical protein
LPTYEVKAVDEAGKQAVLGTVDSATAAMIKSRDARQDYRRVWVTDDTGHEVSAADLLIRSWQERNLA